VSRLLTITVFKGSAKPHPLGATRIAARKGPSEPRRPPGGLPGDGDLAASLSTADNPGNHLSAVQQGLSSQMSVTLGRARLSMPKKVLDHVERHALVHEETGERMTIIPLTELSTLFRQPDYSANGAQKVVFLTNLVLAGRCVAE
jgi:hypothetical protein